MISKVTRYFGVFRMTQTVTQKPRGQESTGEGRMASSVPLPTIFLCLHRLTDDVSDGVGGVTLHLRCGVGVSAEREACGVAALPTAIFALADAALAIGSFLRHGLCLW